MISKFEKNIKNLLIICFWQSLSCNLHWSYYILTKTFVKILIHLLQSYQKVTQNKHEHISIKASICIYLIQWNHKATARKIQTLKYIGRKINCTIVYIFLLSSSIINHLMTICFTRRIEDETRQQQKKWANNFLKVICRSRFTINVNWLSFSKNIHTSH